MQTNSKSKINSSNKSGFTIVETLVAIAVLMIAIAGPLVIASKGLTAALYSKDQMVASFLAQESMEIIKNLRDSAIDEGIGWMENFNGCHERNEGNPCDADPFAADYIKTAAPGTNDGHQIYLDETEGYTSSPGSDAFITPYRRYFYFSDIEGGVPDDNQKIVNVVVKWEVGTIPFETRITGLLTAQTR